MASTGLVLAGGQSSRMGRDKASLPWGDTTLLVHVCRSLQPIVDELLVIVDDASRFPGLGFRVIGDLVPGAHALGGIYTGLKAARNDTCFVCGCDAPFLSADLVEFLFEEVDGNDLVLPIVNGRRQPLHAVYSKSALSVIEGRLQDEKWQLKDLADELNCKIVDEETVSRIDPGLQSFININTAGDYEQALDMASS